MIVWSSEQRVWAEERCVVDLRGLSRLDQGEQWFLQSELLRGHRDGKVVIFKVTTPPQAEQHSAVPHGLRA